MTAIVILTDGKRVVLGGDSAATGGYEVRLRADEKVFRSGSYGIGFTSSYRMGQILRYKTELPEPPRGVGPDELHRFLVTEFVGTVRQAFAEHGFSKRTRFPSPGA